MVRLEFLAALLASLLASAALAATEPERKYYVPEVPADMEPVDFYLETIGLGDDLAGRYGHTGIRIRDKANGTDVVFNWGKFYFDQPGFGWKFFRGSLTYSMGVRTFQGDVLHWVGEGRKMTQEKLNLTLKQKRRLLEKIAWNAIPENRDFAYQYFFKNCATIPRDYLDEVLEGQVRARYFSQDTGKTYRDYVRSNLAAVPFVVPLLDVLMNANIDRPITAWEEMFYPIKLREQLLAMPSVDDEGNPVAGTKLLAETTVLLDYPEVWDLGFDDYTAAMLPAAAFLAGGLVLLALARRRPGLSAAGYRLLGLATLVWGLESGVIGATLLLNWFFSGHPDGWHNVNLLLFWPLDFAWVVLGWGLLRAGAPLKDRWPFVRAGRLLSLGHLLALALLVGLAATSVIEQNVWRVVAFYGTVTVALSVALATLGLTARLEEPAAAGAPVAPVRKPKLRPAR